MFQNPSRLRSAFMYFAMMKPSYSTYVLPLTSVLMRGLEQTAPALMALAKRRATDSLKPPQPPVLGLSTPPQIGATETRPSLRRSGVISTSTSVGVAMNATLPQSWPGFTGLGVQDSDLHLWGQRPGSCR